MLDNILELPLTSVTADSVLRAIRAYSCLDHCGRWTDPPSHVVFTAERPAPESLSRGEPAPRPARRSLGVGGSLGEGGGLNVGEPALLGPGSGYASEAAAPAGAGIPDSSATDSALIADPRLEIPLSD
jgi:hypothetical protein